MSDAIQETKSLYSNHVAPRALSSNRIALLAGGVGGARAARAFAAVLAPGDLTVIGNIGDDDERYGVYVAADLDTIVYTLAGIEGPYGWGVAGDTFAVMDRLADLGEDVTFRLGDRDLANCLWRTLRLAAGDPLSATIAASASALGVEVAVLPASDQPVPTIITTVGGEELSFQDYFVIRAHRDEVAELSYAGADLAAPAPGVFEAIEGSDAVVIAPSNPPLSIWPILAVDAIRASVAAHPRVVAISPLFGGVPLKGPAHRVMASLGLPPGNAGVAAAYEGLISDLVVDTGDAEDADALDRPGLTLHVMDTRLTPMDAGKRFAAELLELLG